jgi:hypothetical protein
MRWCWHDWTAWTDVRTDSTGTLLQERRCTTCNKAKRREETTWLFDDDGDGELPQ